MVYDIYDGDVRIQGNDIADDENLMMVKSDVSGLNLVVR